MPRGFALFLIATGGVFCAIGILAIILAAPQLPAAGIEILIAGLICDALGAVLLIVGIKLFQRADSRPAPSEVPGAANLYVPNREVTQELDGVPYTVHFTPPVPGKHPRPSVLRISTPVAAMRGEFHMSPETWFDKICKRYGLAMEIETGDPVFDAECYVRSDTPEFAAAYVSDPIKRVAILDLRRLGFPEVLLRDGVLTATWTGFNPKVHGTADLPADTAARLVILSRNLPEHRPEFEHRVGTHRKTWQRFLWLFLIGFALTLFSLLAYPPIDGLALFWNVLMLLVPGYAVFAYVAARLLRGTSTSHRAWGGLMLGAVFVFPAGSFGTITLINGLFDASPPVEHHAVIVEKFTTTHKKRTNYHVRVASWLAPGKTESFQISATDYRAVVPHQSHLVVTTHAGLLGLERMKSKRVEIQPPRP